MAARTPLERSLVTASSALVALWLVLAIAISGFALHLTVAAVRDADVGLADAAGGLSRMAISMGERGMTPSQIATAVTSAARSRGLDVDSHPFPARPPMTMREGSRIPPLMPPFGIMVPPEDMAAERGPFDPPSVMLHIGDAMLILQLHENPWASIVRGYAIAMLVLLVVAILVTALLERRQRRRALAPVATLESALRRLAMGEYARLEVLGDEPERAGVVDAYNAAADELASSVRLRAEAESNLRQFVADAGHELRTPLTVIMGFVDVLRQGAIAEQALAQRILDSVAAEGERMRRLIARLLMLSRLDAVAPERRETVDLTQIVADTVESFRPLAGDTKLSTKLEPDVSVTGSASDVREIVGILVDNALKYAPGSNVVVSTEREDGFGVIVVADDGPGMAPDLRVRAFDRFSRGDERGSVPGSGLGLAIVKRIVVRAEGDVDLASAPGKGTQVRVRLPLAGG
jgi:signal transduction histidine kinase